MQFYALAGPTATGKTEVALELSAALNAVIVSCDSVLVYKLMDIGSNKPSGAPLTHHHLVNLVYPWEEYNAYHFLLQSHALFQQIAAQGQNVLLVGGTMLYFKLLCEGLTFPFHDRHLVSDLEQRSRQDLERSLSAHYGPNLALHHLDKRKIIRKTEIMLGELGGSSSYQTIPPLQKLKLCAFFSEDRTAIYQRIESRLAQMCQDGFMAEMAFLYQHPLMQRHFPSMQSIGYKQAWAYLAGEITYPTFYAMTLSATRRLAKKQCTWLRHWKHALQLIESTLPFSAKIQKCLTYFLQP